MIMSKTTTNSKKSFILYNDICEVFSDLNNEQAGELIKYIIEYNANLCNSNDLDKPKLTQTNPMGLSGLMKAIANPFVKHLYRDYQKWENKQKSNILNGKKGGRPKELKPKLTQTNPKKPVNVNVNVNVNEEQDQKHDKKTKLKTKNNDDLFDNFRKRYRGKKRGLQTEFDNFKKHKDWREVLINLEFVNFDFSIDTKYIPHLKTYINQRRWEDESPKITRQQLGQQQGSYRDLRKIIKDVDNNVLRS